MNAAIARLYTLLRCTATVQPVPVARSCPCLVPPHTHTHTLHSISHHLTPSHSTSLHLPQDVNPADEEVVAEALAEAIMPQPQEQPSYPAQQQPHAAAHVLMA